MQQNTHGIAEALVDTQGGKGLETLLECLCPGRWLTSEEPCDFCRTRSDAFAAENWDLSLPGQPSMTTVNALPGVIVNGRRSEELRKWDIPGR